MDKDLDVMYDPAVAQVLTHIQAKEQAKLESIRKAAKVEVNFNAVPYMEAVQTNEEFNRMTTESSVWEEPPGEFTNYLQERSPTR